MKTLIIAEAGVNHNGDINLAKKLIEIAAEAGANIVKFQTFKAKNLVTDSAPQADYQTTNTGKKESQLAMLRRLELSHESHHDLVSHCKKYNIEFLSTAFDFESLAFLVDTLGLKTLKIPSGEITNAPFLLAHAKTGCNIILSTGMATIGEIETALGVIAFGYTAQKNTAPSITAFQEAYYSQYGQESLKEKVCLLHCTTEYPAPFSEINLRAMDTLSHTFKLPVGYSDHSEGIFVPIAAVARGATLIEKHFTLDKNLAGPDHKASLSPSELKNMVQGIRAVDLSLGNGLKIPSVSEIKNKAVARKSIVAAKPMTKGQIISPEDLALKRPGSGKSPYLYWDLIGKTTSQTYNEGDLILE